MNRTRIAAALGLALLLGAAARSQDERPTRPQRPPRGGGPGGFFGFLNQGPLLSKDDQAKLKLSDEQKEKVAAIVKDYDKKTKADRDKIQEALRKAREDGDRDAFRGVAEKMRDLVKVRTDAAAKIKDVLNDDQKKTFDEIQRRSGRPGGGFPGGGPGGGPSGLGRGLPNGAQVPGGASRANGGFPGGATGGTSGAPGGGTGGTAGGGSFPQRSGTAGGSRGGQSGFAAGGSAGGLGGGAGGPGGLAGNTQVASALTTLLRNGAAGYRWAAATVGTQSAAPLQLASGEPVMAIGGFNGTDSAPTLAEFKRMVAAGEIHYFVGANQASFGGGSGPATAITAWVRAHFKAQTIGGVTVYDLARSRT